MLNSGKQSRETSYFPSRRAKKTKQSRCDAAVMCFRQIGRWRLRSHAMARPCQRKYLAKACGVGMHEPVVLKNRSSASRVRRRSQFPQTETFWLKPREAE